MKEVPVVYQDGMMDMVETQLLQELIEPLVLLNSKNLELLEQIVVYGGAQAFLFV